MRRVTALMLACLLLCAVAFAHGGGVDSKGGHTDRSTGEYHYHHGYPAHDHENGVCPYDFDDKTGQNSGSSGGSGGGSSSKLYYKTTANVNLRSSASTSGRILTTVPKGKKLLFMDDATDKWVRVKYGTVTGWVYRDYIEKYKSAVTTGLPTVMPTADPTPRPTAKPARKELLPVTLGNIVIIFALGLVVGLALLLWYHKKASEHEHELKREASVRESIAVQKGRDMEIASLRNQVAMIKQREKELSEQETKLIADRISIEQQFDEREARLEAIKSNIRFTATVIKTILPPEDNLTRVLIAERPAPRSLYHRINSYCLISDGFPVSIRVAQELRLSPCPRCKPDVIPELKDEKAIIQKIIHQMDAEANYRPASSQSSAPSQSGWRRH